MSDATDRLNAALEGRYRVERQLPLSSANRGSGELKERR